MRVVALLLSAVLLIAFDQATKAMVVARLREGQAASFGVVAIRRLLNRRPAVGPLGGNAALTTLLLVEFLVLAALVQVGPLAQSDLAPLALGAALGGAAGNLLDRRRRGGIVDFIDLRVWPVFNLADAAIVGGALTGGVLIAAGL